MIFKIPINRVIVFLGPLIAAVSAAVAAWLIANVNILGIPGLDESNAATYIAAALTAILVAALHALGGWAWLKGHHIELEGIAAAKVAQLHRPQLDFRGTQLLAGAPDPDANPDDVPPGLAEREPDHPSKVPPDEGDAGPAGGK